MNKTLSLIVLVALIPGSLLCTSQKKSSHRLMATDISNSQNSLDWPGTYLGVLPCAGCDAVQKTIYLYQDGGYRIRIKYLGKDVHDTEITGKIEWTDDGNSITLKELGGEDQSYLVGESRLTQLDRNGAKIIGALATRYILSKERYAILDKYWQLTELNGKLVVADSSFKNEPHIIFKGEGNQFTGNGGCNDFSGAFEFGDLDRISLLKATSTRTACPSIGWEMEFLKALAEVENFTVTGDRLVLRRDRSVPVAKFKTVYLK